MYWLISIYALKLISKQNSHDTNEGIQGCDVIPNLHQEIGESRSNVGEFPHRNDVSSVETDREDNCLFRLPDRQHTRVLTMCVEYPQVCETCIERYANLKYRLRTRFLENLLPLPEVKEELTTIAQELAELFNVQVDVDVQEQSQNEYWCDIAGVRVKYTQKEYERQMLQQKPVETKIHKPKKISKKKTSSMLSRLSKAKVHVQSEVEIGSSTVDDAGGSTSTQNVEFLDQNPGTLVTISELSDTTMTGDAQMGIELGDFLKRPVLIHSYSWLESQAPQFITGIKPWYLFLNATPIKKKLDNYAFLHGNLKVKIVLNASPFYYGSMYFAYNPLADVRDNTITGDAGFNHMILYSQRPGIWVLPQTSQGGELTLPFTYHRNMLDITVATDVQAMGTLDYLVVNQLTSANGATGTGVTVQVYAWMEDVQLANSTVKLSLQSQDEYGGGSISAPASAVATALGSLDGVPIIGKYMRASSMIASTVGSVAKLFGFTNVPNIDTVSYTKICAFPQFASSEISTPVEKLTLDPKNELTIDPRTVGLPPNDELMISYLATKESYLGSATIATTDAVDAMVFISSVHPKLHGFTAGAPVAYQTTPMCYLQHCFNYWRGDIIFRFRFICTKFHKGRMRITYDPIGAIGTTPDNYSTSFNTIVDYGEEQDIEVRVPYSQAYPWLTTSGDLSTILWNTVGTNVAHVNAVDNGTITLRVVTPLSAPLATASLGVQIFVRAADNFELALPRDVEGFSHLVVQSQDEVSFDGPQLIVAGNAIGSSHPDRYHINMGENIKSMRQVLRRTMFSEAFTNNSAVTFVQARTMHKFNLYPRPPGFDADGYYLANKTLSVGTATFNFSRMTHYNWLAPCYVGQRGSMMWKINVDTSGRAVLFSNINITRYGSTITSGDWVGVTGTAAATTSQVARFAHQQTQSLQGMSMTNPNTQTALSVLCPDYSQMRFHFTSPTKANVGQFIDGSDTNNFKLCLQYTSALTTNADTIVVSKYVSIGPDFNFYFWINCPSIFFIGEPTAA